MLLNFRHLYNKAKLMKNKDLREQYKDVKYDEDDIEATLANADDAINKLMVNICKL